MTGRWLLSEVANPVYCENKREPYMSSKCLLLQFSSDSANNNNFESEYMKIHAFELGKKE